MSCGFVAYIDESGDDGLARVQPIDAGGSSEWFVLSAVVVRESRENEVGRWQRDILKSFGYTQRPDIHYRKLTEGRKRLACQYIARQPLRIFVFMSNKKNMRGYSNKRCAEEPYYFYWWCSRILLERVTKFCASASKSLYGEYRPVKMVFAQRGGMAYPRLLAYLGLLQHQSSGGNLFITAGDLNWRVVDLDQIYNIAAKNEAGLQLADVAAGAFYEAVNREKRTGPDATYAKLLFPRLYKERNLILGNGLKPMPALWQAKLDPSQREIFELAGYPENRW
jgi:hypothetical protein